MRKMEAQEDLRANKNLGTYKGAIYENIVGDMLVKQGYDLFYYRSDKPSLKMDFFVRDADSLIPVEVKATDGATASLNNLLKENKYKDIKYEMTSYSIKKLPYASLRYRQETGHQVMYKNLLLVKKHTEKLFQYAFF